MSISDYKNLNSNLYNKLTFDDVMRHFDENHSLRATFQNIFNQIASMNGDAGTIDQSELEMLYQMMQKHDKNADGSINNDENNNELQAFYNEFIAQAKSKNPDFKAEFDERILRVFISHMLAKLDSFKDYNEGLINGFPQAEFASAIEENYTETETKNLKDIYRFFSDDKNEDGSYSDFESSSMDRRSYINLGWMANKYLKGKEANSKQALEQMLTAMKQQAGGMLDNCTVEDLQNFLAIEDTYSAQVDDLETFQVRKNEVFHPVSVSVYKEKTINYNSGRDLDENNDGHVTEQEFSKYNTFVHNASRYGTNVQLCGECFFDASVNALGRELADPVFDDKNGVVRVTIEGIIDPKTSKPITVSISYEELAARKLGLEHNQEPKILVYGMAVEKLYHEGVVSRLTSPEDFRDDVLGGIQDTEQAKYNQIADLVSEFSRITDPEQRKAKFVELSNQIDEILNDPDLQAYTTLITNVRALKEQISLICVDSTPLATAIKELSTNKNNQIAQRTMRNITNDLHNISSDISRLFNFVPVDKAEIERLEQQLNNFATRNINDEVSNSQDPQAIKILSDFENAKNKLNQIKNCTTISGTINEFKKAPKNIDVHVALESHFRVVDTEASNAETPQQKTQALRKINDFLAKLNALKSDEYVIERLISSLETTKEVLTNPDTEILEIIEDEIEIEETELRTPEYSFGERRAYIPFEELNVSNFVKGFNSSLERYQTQTDARVGSDAYEQEIQNTYGLLGIAPDRYYGDIGRGGRPKDILNLLTNKNIQEISVDNYQHDIFRGATLSLHGDYGKILGYGDAAQSSGHTVTIRSAKEDAILIYDTNTGKERWIPKDDLKGENIRATIHQVGKSERRTYLDRFS